MKRVHELEARGRIVLLLALHLAGWLASFVHQVAVPHEVCREHGELVEAGAAAAAGEGREGAQLAPAGEPHAEEHHHCIVLALARERFTVFEDRAPALQDVEARVAPAPRDPSACWTSFPRYLLAPNHSPPSPA